MYISNVKSSNKGFALPANGICLLKPGNWNPSPGNGHFKSTELLNKNENKVAALRAYQKNATGLGYVVAYLLKINMAKKLIFYA